jgi:hypothetical protein
MNLRFLAILDPMERYFFHQEAIYATSSKKISHKA